MTFLHLKQDGSEKVQVLRGPDLSLKRLHFGSHTRSLSLRSLF